MANEVMVAGARQKLGYGPMDLIDEVSTANHVWPLLVCATRYVVSDDVTMSAAQLMSRLPEILLQVLVSARVPAPVVWLEWSDQACVRAVGVRCGTATTKPESGWAPSLNRSLPAAGILDDADRAGRVAGQHPAAPGRSGVRSRVGADDEYPPAVRHLRGHERGAPARGYVDGGRLVIKE